MPNTWSYSLQLQPERALTRDMISQALEVVRNYGYTLPCPVVLTSNNGMDEATFDSIDTLQEYLVQRGGCVVLWSESGVKDLLLRTRPERRSIEVGILQALRPEQPNHREIANDLEQIFLALCDSLRPFYGFSSGEWLVEGVLGDNVLEKWAAFEEEIQRGEAPRLLFWLNYLSAACFARIGEETLASLLCSITSYSHASVVRLARYPWEMKMALRQNDGGYTIA